MTRYEDQNLAPSEYEDYDPDDSYYDDFAFSDDGDGVLDEAVFHGEGIYNGALSIDEMIERLSNTVVSLLALREAGWTLASPVTNDYADLILESPVV